MLTRRTFLEKTGTLALGTVAGASIRKNEIKEHGLVEIRMKLFGYHLIAVKSTIFADEDRDVFGIRILGKRGPSDARLVETELSAVIKAVAFPGHIWTSRAVCWSESGQREEWALELVVKNGNLLIAQPGFLEEAPQMDLADVQEVI
jgi:hypothetical protein